MAFLLTFIGGQGKKFYHVQVAAGGTSFLVHESDGTSKFLLENGPPLTLTFDATATGNSSSGTSLSWSHTTTTNSDRILIVGVSWRGTGSVSTVTYNAVSMTSIGSASGPNNTKMEMFRLVSPSTGTNTVQVTFTGSIDGSVGGSYTFYNAHQSSFGTFASNTGSAGVSPATVDVSSASGETVVDCVSWDRSPAMTAGGGQTERWDADDNGDADIRGGGSTEAGATTVTMSWTGGSEGWAIGGVSVKPVFGPAVDAIILEA